ncbi:hypothetical protein [Bordetella genomosp. 4]|uniref:Uncharacterized protein n=1 Tax=Bordetella genomosp. 4 TaxID=463044 RepID=A0A261U9Y2_9BORD|nr:hypothetical protein [Bordetella genomosp. 4]OZI57673.1 hypothetical protein CAL20_09875 [Bordetella genomosp. 4]
MENMNELQKRVDDLEERVKGLQLGLHNLVISICARGSIDISAVAQSYKKLNEATRETFGLAGLPSGEAMDAIGTVLEASGAAVDKALQQRDNPLSKDAQ